MKTKWQRECKALENAIMIEKQWVINKKNYTFCSSFIEHTQSFARKAIHTIMRK